MKIVVKKAGLAYHWQPAELDPEKLVRAEQMHNENIDQNENYILLITQTAQKDIFDFIHWGDHKTKINQVEQGGLLAGSYYFIPSSGKKICVVERAFPVDTAVGTPCYWDASAEDWQKAFAAMDRYGRETGRELFSLGWFHTHPNRLSTFMSDIDRRTQAAVFNDDASFALVLNPHTGSWKAYRSRDVLDAYCMMTADNAEELLHCQPEQENDVPPQPVPETAVNITEPQESTGDLPEELHKIEHACEKQKKLLKQWKERLKVTKKKKRAKKKRA